MAIYNVTYQDTANTLIDLFNGLNSLKDGWFGCLLLFAFWFISMAVFNKGGNMANSALLSSFATAFIAMILFGIGMIPSLGLTIPLILLGVSIVMRIWVNG